MVALVWAGPLVQVLVKVVHTACDPVCIGMFRLTPFTTQSSTGGPCTARLIRRTLKVYVCPGHTATVWHQGFQPACIQPAFTIKKGPLPVPCNWGWCDAALVPIQYVPSEVILLLFVKGVLKPVLPPLKLPLVTRFSYTDRGCRGPRAPEVVRETGWCRKGGRLPLANGLVWPQINGARLCHGSGGAQQETEE